MPPFPEKFIERNNSKKLPYRRFVPQKLFFKNYAVHVKVSRRRNEDEENEKNVSTKKLTDNAKVGVGIVGIWSGTVMLSVKNCFAEKGKSSRRKKKGKLVPIFPFSFNTYAFTLCHEKEFAWKLLKVVRLLCRSLAINVVSERKIRMGTKEI